MACTDSDYAYLRELVLAQSANLIDPSRNALFDTRLTPIARMAGASNLEDFVNILKADRPVHLHRAVAEAMTINETSFFRDLKPFEMLQEVILPRLIEQRAAGSDDSGYGARRVRPGRRLIVSRCWSQSIFRCLLDGM